MNRQRLILLILFTLFNLSFTYNIEGPWRLSQSQLQTQNSSIVFDFKKQLTNGIITPTLTIVACRVIEFNFTQNPLINGNGNIGFLMTRLGIQRELCLADEVRDIIVKMQKIAQAKILLNTLILSSPSGHEVFRLSKIITTSPLKNLTGNWEIIQLNQKPTSIQISANNMSIFLCGNNATVNYNFGNQNIIDFMIKSVKGCGENQALSQLFRGRYIRQFQGNIYLYDSDSEVTMKMIRNIGRISVQGFVQEPDNIQIQTLATQPNTTAIITTGTATPSSLPFIMNPHLSEFLSTWYSSSLNLTITNQILRVYGDCGMWYSLINVGGIIDGKLNLHVGKASNSQFSCLGNAEGIQGQLNRIRAFSLQSNGSEKILSTLSQDGLKIREWFNKIQ